MRHFKGNIHDNKTNKIVGTWEVNFSHEVDEVEIYIKERDKKNPKYRLMRIDGSCE